MTDPVSTLQLGYASDQHLIPRVCAVPTAKALLMQQFWGKTEYPFQLFILKKFLKFKLSRGTGIVQAHSDLILLEHCVNYNAFKKRANRILQGNQKQIC